MCFITALAGAVAKYCGEYVCVCVCLYPCGYLRNHTRDLYKIFVHVIYGRGSVLLRRHCGTLCMRIHYVLPVLWMTWFFSIMVRIVV